jgi:hypothetical protein
MDATSAGILIYASLVEVRHFHPTAAQNDRLTACSFVPLLQLMAHDFLFNKEMLAASNGRVAFAVGSMMLGSALMALLGKWA